MTSQSLAGTAAGGGVERLLSGMHGMSAGRPAPRGSSTGRNVYAVSAPAENWFPGGQ